jgi:hypothetical protein
MFDVVDWHEKYGKSFQYLYNGKLLGEGRSVRVKG